MLYSFLLTKMQKLLPKIVFIVSTAFFTDDVLRPKNSTAQVRESSIIQCCIYPGQWFDQWICVRKKNKYSTKYWVPQSMIDVFVPEVEISPQVRKYRQNIAKYNVLYDIAERRAYVAWQKTLWLSLSLFRTIKSTSWCYYVDLLTNSKSLSNVSYS